MPFDPRDYLPAAPPQLAAALEATEKLLKKLRTLRNKGRATDADVEDARAARDRVLAILDRQNWREETDAVD